MWRRLIPASKGSKSAYACLLILWSLLGLSIGAKGQISESAASRAARAQTRFNDNLDALSAYRKEDIEDRLRSLAASPRNAQLFVFSVSNEGYEFQEDRVVHHLSSDGPFSWCVAVLPSGTSFEIDTREGFNGVAEALRINILDDVQAQEYLYLYLDVRPEHGIFDEVVRTPLQLKQTAEAQFTRAYNDFGEAETAFQRWWERNSERLLKVALSASFSKTGEGFSAKFYVLSAVSHNNPAAGPALLEVSLPISKHGLIGEARFTPVRE
jgi:hypothetical protein